MVKIKIEKKKQENSNHQLHISGMKYNRKESESLHGNLMKVGTRISRNEGGRERCGARKDGFQNIP